MQLIFAGVGIGPNRAIFKGLIKGIVELRCKPQAGITRQLGIPLAESAQHYKHPRQGCAPGCIESYLGWRRLYAGAPIRAVLRRRGSEVRGL